MPATGGRTGCSSPGLEACRGRRRDDHGWHVCCVKVFDLAAAIQPRASPNDRDGIAQDLTAVPLTILGCNVCLLIGWSVRLWRLFARHVCVSPKRASDCDRNRHGKTKETKYTGRGEDDARRKCGIYFGVGVSPACKNRPEKPCPIFAPFIEALLEMIGCGADELLWANVGTIYTSTKTVKRTRSFLMIRNNYQSYWLALCGLGMVSSRW